MSWFALESKRALAGKKVSKVSSRSHLFIFVEVNKSDYFYKEYLKGVLIGLI